MFFLFFFWSCTILHRLNSVPCKLSIGLYMGGVDGTRQVGFFHSFTTTQLSLLQNENNRRNSKTITELTYSIKKNLYIDAH